VGRDSYTLGLALIATLALACSGESEDSGDTAVSRGAQIYRNICVVCHSSDPNQDGPLGPAIAGASLDLLEARLLRGEYPAGYTPKRNTKQMPQFEFLEPNLDDLFAFLASRQE
jgi:mono/diheme cytochrome c family protein